MLNEASKVVLSKHVRSKLNGTQNREVMRFLEFERFRRVFNWQDSNRIIKVSHSKYDYQVPLLLVHLRVYEFHCVARSTALKCLHFC